MKKNIQIILFGFLVFITISMAGVGAQIPTVISTDDIFQKLNYNHAGDSEFVLDPHSTVNLSKDTLTFEFVELCGHVKSYKVLINSTCTRQIPYYAKREICENHTDNETEATKFCYNTSYIHHYTQENYTCFLEAKEIRKKMNTYKIVADIEYAICDGYLGYKIDWIPSLTIIGKKYTKKDWAWWNASYQYRMSWQNLSTANLGLHCNSTVGFCRYQIIANPYQCAGNLSFYYNNCNDFVLICNDSLEMNYDVTNDSSISHNPESVYSNNAKGVWHFDINNSANDSTINSNDGTIYSASWNATGEYGGALDLDGVDDYIEVSPTNNLDGFTEISVFLWAKPSKSGNNEIIIKHDGGSSRSWGMFQDDFVIGGRIGGVLDECRTTGNYFALGEWHYIGMVWNGTNIKMYIDGVERSSCSNSHTMVSSTAPLDIGRVDGSDNFHQFLGIMDEIHVYNRSLSADEIEEQYNQSLGKYNNFAAEEEQPTTECSCSNCSDCNNKLNNATCAKVYLTANITNYTGTCIDDPQNFTNKTFDCQGHTIDGDDIEADYGIYLDGKSNNTIKNCVITDFYRGFYLYSFSNSTLTDNTANNNTYGIYLSTSSSNTLTNNTANNNTYGIYLSTSSSNTLTNNTANNNSQHGIYLHDSDNNNFTSNTVKFNQRHGFYAISTSTGNILNQNVFCSNNQAGGYYDIYDADSNSGDNNTCDTTYNWNDTGMIGCTYFCTSIFCSAYSFDPIPYEVFNVTFNSPCHCKVKNAKLIMANWTTCEFTYQADSLGTPVHGEDVPYNVPFWFFFLSNSGAASIIALFYVYYKRKRR